MRKEVLGENLRYTSSYGIVKEQQLVKETEKKKDGRQEENCIFRRVGGVGSSVRIC